jgi:hypothetical protein
MVAIVRPFRMVHHKPNDLADRPLKPLIRRLRTYLARDSELQQRRKPPNEAGPRDWLYIHTDWHKEKTRNRYPDAWASYPAPHIVVFVAPRFYQKNQTRYTGNWLRRLHLYWLLCMLNTPARSTAHQTTSSC